MIQYLIVLAIVLAASLYWLNRLLPAQAARLKARLGLAAPVSAQGSDKKGCGGCTGCKGGGCH
ncbi:hypothetical protein ACFFGF_04475 [Asaia lannensis]|uniref:FeoB-associated Cys-rich membrane protein n=1 Tax=Asaia lannensis NBRC 102526 TaxID=1307926 RepID=A0ABT1CHZ3_9PROT|nr:hypothetical protein [Asaia lannensis]MCO6160201.1 hypothetical protein [Asaia lannensis NBRC 102526]GBQ99855.1 hypothetical protein AA102526_1951 [Asaia lannensis NBRC 102526]